MMNLFYLICRDLRVNIENNMKLLRSIASSQDRSKMEKNVKELMTFSKHLQKEDEQPDLTQNEIRDIVNSAIMNAIIVHCINLYTWDSIR